MKISIEKIEERTFFSQTERRVIELPPDTCKVNVELPDRMVQNNRDLEELISAAKKGLL